MVLHTLFGIMSYWSSGFSTKAQHLQVTTVAMFGNAVRLVVYSPEENSLPFILLQYSANDRKLILAIPFLFTFLAY
jgi:hypothetical protein